LIDVAAPPPGEWNRNLVRSGSVTVKEFKMADFLKTTILWIGVLAFIGLASASFADEAVPSGTTDIDEFSIAHLGQATLGGGMVDYQGETHRFKTGGLGVGGAGVSKVSAKGHVYNLKNLEHFDGEYVEGRTGIVVGDASAGDLWLRNIHDVVLRLKAKRKGIMLALGGDAITITMDA
jgi:hypothetical protein